VSIVEGGSVTGGALLKSKVNESAAAKVTEEKAESWLVINR
jgi:hypothetical protein